jgi:hypothetical protein
MTGLGIPDEVANVRAVDAGRAVETHRMGCDRVG